MPYPTNSHDQRREQRFSLEFPAQINIGSQLVLNGKLKDLSSKGAFISLKTDSVYFRTNDEIGFTIQCPTENGEKTIQGLACISRIAIGAGLAVYFIKMDKKSEDLLKKLISQ